MNMFMQRALSAGLFGLAIVGTSAFARADAKADAAQQRETATSLRKDSEAYTAKAATYEGDLKTAVDQYTAEVAKRVLAHEELASALEAGDMAKAGALGEKLSPLTDSTNRLWRKVTAMETAKQYAQPLGEDAAANTSETAKPTLEALVAARKAASESYGKFASAITPDATPAAIDEAYDAAVTSAEAVMLAQMSWQAARDIEYRKTTYAASNNPELTKKAEEFEKATKEAVETQRQQNDLSARLRKLERTPASETQAKELAEANHKRTELNGKTSELNKQITAITESAVAIQTGTQVTAKN